jgi:hypothetical protein
VFNNIAEEAVKVFTHRSFFISQGNIQADFMLLFDSPVLNNLFVFAAFFLSAPIRQGYFSDPGLFGS